MKVLVACEESQEVCKSFRALGHEAYSCDIEPYMFGDSEKKKTGLWLRGLPALTPTNVVEPIIIECASGAREPRWNMETMHLPPKERSKVRSKTFPGIARAMDEQWGGKCNG